MKAKKSLGQNFLKSKTVLGIIIKTADIQPDDIIFEIGPGKGFLTEELLKKAKKVIVIEKDDRLIGFLEEKFADFIKLGNLEIIHTDVLDLNIDSKGIFYQKTLILNNNYKIIANIPYYITGQIIRKFLSSDFQPSKMVLMVQKEVARRIVDKPESILSLSVKVYGEPKYIKTVKAENFSPKPKVDSAVLLINNISKDFFKNLKSEKKENIEENLFNLIKTGFSHKRKILIGNLKKDYSGKENLEKVFKNIGISPKIRAEELGLGDWKKIFENLEN